MTGAAVARRAVSAGICRVRVVTTNASPGGPALRVVGVDRGMARCAGFFCRPAHVVRRVARAATVVRRHSRSSERVQAGVTRLTHHGRLTLEVVGPVTAHASFVAAGEQSARWHLRFVLGMALRACRERDGGGSVLVLVAARAHLRRRLPAGGVSRGDVRVTLGAGARLRNPVFVGAVALQAFARAVHRDGRGVSLRLEVAAAAILGARHVVHPRSGLSRRRFAERERMTSRAIRLRARTEARARLLRRVLEPRLLLVAGRTLRGIDHTYRVGGEIVALRARDLLLHDVLLMPADAARFRPLRPDVHTEAV
jgi:hypothetical protein